MLAWHEEQAGKGQGKGAGTSIYLSKTHRNSPLWPQHGQDTTRHDLTRHVPSCHAARAAPRHNTTRHDMPRHDTTRPLRHATTRHDTPRHDTIEEVLTIARKRRGERTEVEQQRYEDCMQIKSSDSLHVVSNVFGPQWKNSHRRAFGHETPITEHRPPDTGLPVTGAQE